MSESGFLAKAAAVVTIVSGIVAINEAGWINIFPRFVTSSTCGFATPAEITASTDRAPKGAAVTVHGSCFDAGERVVIRVHVTEVGSATADSAGKFVQEIKVPQSAPPAGFPTSIIATGRSSIKTATAPFTTK